MQKVDSSGQDPSPRRRMIMQVIDDAVQRNGYPPSLREIGEAVGLASTSSVSYHLSILKEQGLVSREPRRPRTARTLPKPTDRSADGIAPGQEPRAGGEAMAGVPLVGRIAAGAPITAAELPGDVISLPRLLVGHGDLIMLTVAGDSMTGAAIADGDWVVVRRAPDAESGDIVAAMLDSADGVGEATVKTLRKHDGHVWLMPQNPAYTPIPGDGAVIIGKVVAIMRRV
jgi:repressor LexA